jgi:hypothetical protein
VVVTIVANKTLHIKVGARGGIVGDKNVDIPYTVRFEESPNYLYALVHGDKYGYDVLAGFLREIAEECKKRGLSQVLIEENISATTSEEDVFRIASDLAAFGFSDIRMAYIDRFSDQNELNEYGRKIAEESGIDVRIFNSFEEADKWLSEGRLTDV